jgi:MFS family permease
MIFRPLFSRLSYLDAFFGSLMVGVGETYFVAAALEVGVSPISSGLLLPVSMVLGAFLSSMLLPKLEKLPSLKNLVVTSVFAQALCFIPIGLLVFNEVRSEAGFLLAVTLYHFFGFLQVPVWNLWFSLLVPEKEISTFFAYRLRVSQGGLLLGLVFGGLFLHDLWGGYSRIEVFAVLFGIAMFGRLISAAALSVVASVQPIVSLDLKNSLKSFFSNASYRSFFGFLFFFYLVVAISSPFVGPFFLLKLNFSYNEYMGTLAGLFVGKFLVLPWGVHLIRRLGVSRVILIGALGVSPLPFLWIWVQSFEGAVLVQSISGAFWALFEIGFSILFFSHLSKKEKIPLLNLYNSFNALAMTTGGLLGAWLLEWRSQPDLSYDLIFGWGAGLRLILVLGIILSGIHRYWPQSVEDRLEIQISR